MSFTLGNTPQTMTVQLAAGADFISTIRKPSGDWPDGITVELRFGDVVWAAEVVDDEIRWNVDKAQVAPLLTQLDTPAELFYVAGAVELKWADGNIVVG